MTTLTINVTNTLKDTLDVSGKWAWAVYFTVVGTGSSAVTTVHATQLAGQVSGSQQVDQTTVLDLPGSLNGGKVYLIEQSIGGATPVDTLTFGSTGIIQEESDLNWNSASAYNFRYDSFEVSLLGSAGDAGNLTDVTGFGMPMSVEVQYPNGAATQTRSYAVSGDSMWGRIDLDVSPDLLHDYTQGPLAGLNRMAASPSTALAQGGPGGASATDWKGYVESFGPQAQSLNTAGTPVYVAGYFNGAPSVEYVNYNGSTYSYYDYHNAGFYSYKVTYAAGTGTAGNYTFTPEDNSQIRGTISITTADLMNSIYATNGNATVTSPDGTPYQFSTTNGTLNPYMNTGDNNEWGAFFVKLLTGFIAGYYGGSATPVNSQLGTTPVDLNDNWNFDPTYAFGGSVGVGQPGHVTPWSWSTGTYGSGVSYDPYAKVFFENTNSYGNGYSDAVTSLFQQGGPLVNVGYSDTLSTTNPIATTLNSSTVTVTDANASTYSVGELVFLPIPPVVGGLTLNAAYAITSIGAGTYQFSVGTSKATATTTGGGSNLVFQKDVPNISLTLFDDSETPTGYTPTEIFDTHAPPYVAPLGGASADLSLIIDFGLGQMRPDPGSTVKIGFYTSTTGGLANFTYVNILSSTTNPLYETWNFSTSGGNQFNAAQGASPTGSILQLNDMPYDNGINWYQIVITSPSGVSRAYNLYAEAVAGSGVVNPYYPGAAANALAIDNLAQIPTATLPSTQQYTKSLNISAFNGGTLSMDPTMMKLIMDMSIIGAGSNSATWPKAVAPALGTLDGTTFSNWGGSTNVGTPNDPTALTNVTSGELAFGWVGSDQTWIGYNASLTQKFINNYSNKVSGQDFAEITFTSSDAAAPASVTATADIDGKWATSTATQFGNGTYQAIMTEYQWTKSGVLDLTKQVANPSSALTFTVDIQQLSFKNVGGSFIELDGSSGSAGGNWIRLETTHSSMPNGTLLVYATDAEGHLIGRDGETGSGVTLDEAVLARIGSVATDGGALLFGGAQSVYLKVGQQLHFAVQTGNDVIQQLPNVLVTGNDHLSVKVNGTFGTLDLSASVDNTLSASATLAGSQRLTDDPWVKLMAGQQVHVEVAGSAENVNTIHFVHMDVNASTGAWSVGGVAYGNTDAFRGAVQANWDPASR